MIEKKHLVESLGYIGGQDEDLGGYCEPLIIRFNGEENYVLHIMSQYRDENDVDNATGVEKIKSKHEKAEFRTLIELTDGFEMVKTRLRVDKKLSLVETDENCRYNISKEEFVNARRISRF